MSFRKRNESFDEPAEPVKVYQGCKFHGCKMPAGIVLSQNEFVCRLHDGVSFTDAEQVTMKARNRRIPYRIAYILVNAPNGAPIPKEARATLKQAGYGQTLAENGGTARAFGARLMAILDAECTAHIETPTEIEATTPAANNDWYAASERAMARFMS